MCHEPKVDLTSIGDARLPALQSAWRSDLNRADLSREALRLPAPTERTAAELHAAATASVAGYAHPSP
jgi:hypothetical protein